MPYFTIILRKAYGLGAVAMAGGNYRAPYFYVSWPTGEFAPMGIEGQVKLGYRAELAAIADPRSAGSSSRTRSRRPTTPARRLNRSTNFSSTT